MKVAGIIAEYNPFHNGHAYHIAQTRRITGADYIVVVMSGDFVQRGEPAIVDKYARARMALQNGADLVIELPTAYACGSAEYFATGAIRTLQSLGVVDVLSFGCETQSLPLLNALADLYLEEPASFCANLQSGLRQGLTFPQARAAATKAYFEKVNTLPSDLDLTRLQELLASPNTILGIEYIKAIQKYNAKMEVVPIQRLGSYHSQDMTGCTYASATAIRQLLKEQAPDFHDAASLDTLKQQVPDDVYQYISSRKDLMDVQDLSSALGYALLRDQRGNLTRYMDVSPDLSDRILSHLAGYTGWESFVQEIKTKQMTHSRISRALLHILLQIQSDSMNTWRQDGFVYYARALGFHKKAAYLLGAIKKNCTVPMLTKLADAKDVLYTYYKDLDRDKIAAAYRLLDTDIFAADLYETMAAVQHDKVKIDEYRHGVIVL